MQSKLFCFVIIVHYLDWNRIIGSPFLKFITFFFSLSQWHLKKRKMGCLIFFPLFRPWSICDFAYVKMWLKFFIHFLRLCAMKGGFVVLNIYVSFLNASIFFTQNKYTCLIDDDRQKICSVQGKAMTVGIYIFFNSITKIMTSKRYLESKVGFLRLRIE